VLDAWSGELSAASSLRAGARGAAVLCGKGSRRFSATTGSRSLGAGGEKEGVVQKGLRGDTVGGGGEGGSETWGRREGG